MMTIEAKAGSSALKRLLTFVAFTMEYLGQGYTNLTVEDKDCDNLIDLLDRYNIEWRFV